MSDPPPIAHARTRDPRRGLGAAAILAVMVGLAPGLAAAQPDASAAVAPEAGAGAAEVLDAAGRAGGKQAAILEVIDLNFDGRHEDALERAIRMQQADAADPWPVVLETYTLYWLMLYDDEDTRYDDRIADSCERTIKLAQARLDVDEDDAEAHFLMGQGLMNRGRLNGWRGRYYKAGRDGERARKHLERTLELRPEWVDARFQLGLYYFFASLIPELVTKWLGWLWFVPTGNADEGIAFLEQVAREGVVYREDARFMTANILTYHVEGRLEEGLPVIREMAARHPNNVLIHHELIEALYTNGIADETIAEAKRLATREPTAERERGWIAMAPMWKARVAVMQDDPEQALTLLAPYLAKPPTRPLWASAWIDLVQGQAFDVLGRREEALVQYERVLAYEKPEGSQRAARLARQAIANPYAPPRPTEISAAP